MSTTLDRPVLLQKFDHMLATLGRLNLSVQPDPIWGEAESADFADVRLTVTGVFVNSKYG